MKHKPTEKQILEKEAEKLWKEACLLVWGNRSIISGKLATVFHHFIPRSRSTLLKWDVKNGVPLTNSEHYQIHHSSNPQVIYDLVRTIRQKRGRAWCRYIDRKEKDHKYSYYTVSFLKKQIAKLKRIIKKYEQGEEKKEDRF